MRRPSRRWTGWLLLAAASTGACNRRVEPDAYGNVEANEVVVGAEATGQLVAYSVIEGEKLAAGATVGTIDPTQLALERAQLVASRAAAASRVNEVARQIEGLEAQRAAGAAQRDGAKAQREAAKAQREALVASRDVARRAYERTERLFSAQAATAQQVDQAERDYRVLREQIKAQEEQIKAQEEQIKAHDRQFAAQGEQVEGARAQRETARAQVAAVEAQVASAGERIRRTQVRNPLAGTVLTTYAKTGEFVQTGQPLYKIADLETVEVRAYVTEPQLASVRLGQTAAVSVDVGRKEHRTVSGTISWISSQAEFTPTPIQTREERADLVYAIKIRVPNPNGDLKIGMPVDVQFDAGAASSGDGK